MTSIEEMSPAQQEVIARASSTEALECQNCGRNCKHVPQLPGGGTAGGEKDTKWAETARSAARCPACGQKPHRKEGRPHQLNNCQMAQAAMALGLTTFPMPTADLHRKAAEMLDNGQMRETPTEAQMARIIAGMPVDEAMAPVARSAGRVTSVPVAQGAPGAEASGTVYTVEPLELPTLPEMKVAPAIKTKEQRETERAEVKRLKDEEKAAAKAARDMARADEKARKAATKSESKKDREARLLKTAENGAVIPDEIIYEDSDYDPLAGVGEAFDTDDEDEDELTPAQMAAIGR